MFSHFGLLQISVFTDWRDVLFDAYLLNKASEQVVCGIPGFGHIYPKKKKTKNIICDKSLFKWNNMSEQECIPVGGVPAAHWPYAGVCFRGGCLLGVSAPGGCLLLGGPLGVECLLREVCLLSGGVSALRGCGIPACTEADTPLPVNRMTNRCKNTTLATTSLRPVINDGQYVRFHKNNELIMGLYLWNIFLFQIMGWKSRS